MEKVLASFNFSNFLHKKGGKKFQQWRAFFNAAHPQKKFASRRMENLHIFFSLYKSRCNLRNKKFGFSKKLPQLLPHAGWEYYYLFLRSVTWGWRTIFQKKFAPHKKNGVSRFSTIRKPLRFVCTFKLIRSFFTTRIDFFSFIKYFMLVFPNPGIF